MLLTSQRSSFVWKIVCVAIILLGLIALLATFANPSNGPANDGLRHIKIGTQLEPPNLDPTVGAAGATDNIVYANIFEGLTRITESGAVAPALASEWTVSADGLVYTFILHKNVRFHDGSLFDVDDVIFTLDRARGPQSANIQKTLFRVITQVRKINSHTVEITLERPFPDLPVLLAWGDAVIVAPESADTNAVHPIGTGPLKFDYWQRSAALHLVKNDEYWGVPFAFDRATFRFIPDPSVAYAALLAGDIDAFPGYPAPENFAQLQKDSRFQTSIGLTEGETILALNHRHPALSKRTVRRALSYAIDKKTLITGALFGYGEPIGSHYNPARSGYVALSDYYPYTPEKTKTLLAREGYKESFTVTLTLPPPAYARRAGELVAAQLRDAGIDVKIENVEWAQWIDRVFIRHDFDMTIVAHTEPMDIDIYTRQDYYFGYENLEFNQLIKRIQQIDDQDQRNQLLQKAQVMLAEDAVNVFLFQLPFLNVWDARIKGFWKEAPLQAIDLTGISLDDA